MEYLLKQKSLQMSSLSLTGVPEITYAPFVMKGTSIYLFLSPAANHYENLSTNAKTSVMMIEDEAGLDNIFKRSRVSFECMAEKMPLDKVDHGIEEAYATRHGKENFNHIKMAHGFDWFKLTIEKGRLVEGFGKAYDLMPKADETFEKEPVTFANPHARARKG